MRLLYKLLPLLALLLWSATAVADYNPADPPEPGVNFTLTTRCEPAEAGTTNHSTTVTYPFGRQVNIYTTARTGFRFVRWRDGSGTTVSTSPQFTYTMPVADVVLTACYEYDPSSPAEPSTPEFKDAATVTYSIYPAGAGYIYGPASGSEFESGTTQSWTAYTNTGYRFLNWTLDGEVISTATNLKWTAVRGEHHLTANYEYSPGNPAEPGTPVINRALTLVCDPPGAATLYGAGSYAEGTDNRVYGSVKQYYRFVDWTDDNGDTVSETLDFRYTMPGRKVTLTAHFIMDYNPANPGEPGEPVPPGSVGENMVAWPRFGMADQSHVMILCETPGSEIHYTLDGSDPDRSSPVYTGPVYVERNLTVKAIAYVEGMEDSPIRSFNVSSYQAAAPEFRFVNRKVEIYSATPGATIRYTLDFSDPTEESEIYTQPLEPEDNCRIKAYASCQGLTDSPVSIYVYRQWEHTLSAPVFTVTDDGKVAVGAGISGAVIRYTSDGSVPDVNSPVYSAPFEITGGMWLTAYASHPDYFDSETAEFRVAHSPEIAVNGNILTITTATEGGVIHYTTDGTAPTEASPVYTEPIAVSGDMTVRAVTVAEGMETSPESRYSASRVSAPVLTYTGRRLSMSTDTEGAVIRYTTDGSVPTSESAVYTDPIELTADCTVRAYASKDGMADSGISEYIFVRSEHTVPTPVATYAAHRLTLECADSEAVILYAVSDDGGDIPSSEYTAPLEMTRDCTVTFKAVREGFFDSETADYRFEASGYTEPSPRIEVDYRERTVTAVPAAGYAVATVIDGVESVSEDTVIIDVTPGMEMISVYTPAADADRYDSESVTLDVVFHLPPVLHYDGHSVSMSKDPADPASGHAEIWGYFNDNLRVYGSGSVPMDVYEFGTASADCRSDHAFRSEPAVMTVDLFNTGRKAGVRGAHRLAEVFGTWGDDPYDYTYLSIRGEVGPEDLRMLGRLPMLTVLDLEPYTMADGDYDGVFAGSRIETLSVNAAPDGILRGMPRLTTVHWGLTNAAMPDGTLTQAGNPNLLLWVTDAANAPADAANTVIHEYIGEGYAIDPEGPGTEGHAGRLTLTPGYPFNVHMPLEADHVELTKEFTQYTVIDACGGWETIALPFAPDRITHESRGDIVPFAAWDGAETGPRPFWLYAATPEDWSMAESIESGRPYIISMPNNDEYIPDYNLAGRVTFEADGVRLTPGDMLPVADEWISGMMFEPVWMPVEGDALSLNAGHDIAEWLPGSVFTADGEVETHPFGACVRTGDGRRNVPVFGGGSGMALPSRDSGGSLSVWLSGGRLYVSSTDGGDCEVRTLTGITVRRVRLEAGETVCVGELAKGVYIIGTVKVMVP